MSLESWFKKIFKKKKSTIGTKSVYLAPQADWSKTLFGIIPDSSSFDGYDVQPIGTYSNGDGTLALKVAVVQTTGTVTGPKETAEHETLMSSNFDVGQATVTSSVTEIVPARTRSNFTIKNTTGSVIYLSAVNNVTTANGYELAVGETLSIRTSTPIFAVTESGSSSVCYYELF